MYAHVQLRRGRCGDDHILWHTREMQGNHQTHIKGSLSVCNSQKAYEMERKKRKTSVSRAFELRSASLIFLMILFTLAFIFPVHIRGFSDGSSPHTDRFSTYCRLS